MAMGHNLQRMARKHKDTLALHPPFRALLDDLYDAPPQPKAELEVYKQQAKNGGPRDGERAIIKRGSLKAADQTMTRFVGGLPKPYGEFPFDSADDYYHYGGCANNIGDVQRPLLCLSAQDDPIVPGKIWHKIRAAIGRNADGPPMDPASAQGWNENVVLAWTKAGGHLGWFEGIRPRRWLYRPTSEFIAALFEHTSRDEKARVQSRSRWASDKVQTKRVEIDSTPAAQAEGTDSPARVASLERDLQSDKRGAEDALLNPSDTGFAANAPPASEPSTDAAAHGTLRMGWLLTRVLKDAPLVHPRHATYATYTPPTPAEAKRLGWETVQLDMYVDAEHPEVGFAELGPETRVAGIHIEMHNGHADGHDEKARWYS
ncbi:hypothetical protein L1887_53618 [Cichorium endivia]|nr:hypothetical protein L1887_53618 [Cichorium endivia]